MGLAYEILFKIDVNYSLNVLYHALFVNLSMKPIFGAVLQINEE